MILPPRIPADAHADGCQCDRHDRPEVPVPMTRAERTKFGLDAQIAILRQITDVVHRDGSVGPEQDPRVVLRDLEQIRDLLYP